jgi:hypothetical protein
MANFRDPDCRQSMLDCGSTQQEWIEPRGPSLKAGRGWGHLNAFYWTDFTPDIVNPKLIVSSLTHAADSHLARTRVAQKFGIRQQQREEVLKMPAGQKLQSVDLIPQLAHSPCHEQGTGHKLSQQS